MQHFSDYFSVFSNRPFLEDDSGECLNYSQALARGLNIIEDVSDEKSLVFLKCSNNNSSVACYIGLLVKNHAVMLIDADSSVETVDSLIQKYEPDYVIDPDQISPVSAFSELNRSKLNDKLNVLLSTSGSTGSPKAACFTEKNLVRNAQAISEYLGLHESDVALAHLPLHYSFGLSVINSHIVSGGRIRLTEFSLMQKEFWSAFNDSGATSFYGVPFHFEMLKRLRHPYRSSKSLRYLAQAGGRLSEALVLEYSSIGEQDNVEFYVMYGQTEAGPRISYLPPELAAENPGSIGIAIPGVTLNILRSSGDPANVGEVGELVCRSPSVMLGYALSRADLRNDDQMGGKLKTGDLGKIDENGLFSITGRSNRFLKVQGTRVGLDDIESRIVNAGFKVACVGVDDSLTLVLEFGQDTESLRRFTNSEFKIPPRSINFKEVDQIPRGSTGKIDYQRLREVLQLNNER